jgi:hypothetical protein
MTRPRQLPSGPLEGDPPPNLFPAAGGPSVKRNTVNDMIITELSHRRRRGRTSRLESHDQETGSTLTGVVVFMAEWSYTKRYVTDALAALYGQAGSAGQLGPDSGADPDRSHRCRDRPTSSCAMSPGPQTPRFARRVEALHAQVRVRGAIAVPRRCTCIDSRPPPVLPCA